MAKRKVAKRKTKARKAKAPKKTKPQPQPQRQPQPQMIAVECVELPVAQQIVMSCAGGDFDVDTKLGDLFPARMRREQFCQCVADDSGVPRTRIPCSGGTTLGGVIEAIAC